MDRRWSGKARRAGIDGPTGCRAHRNARCDDTGSTGPRDCASSARRPRGKVRRNVDARALVRAPYQPHRVGRLVAHETPRKTALSRPKARDRTSPGTAGDAASREHARRIARRSRDVSIRAGSRRAPTATGSTIATKVRFEKAHGEQHTGRGAVVVLRVLGRRDDRRGTAHQTRVRRRRADDRKECREEQRGFHHATAVPMRESHQRRPAAFVSWLST